MAPPSGPITVLLVDDQPFVGDALRRFFGRDGGIELIGQRLDPADLSAQLGFLRPRVLLLDFSIPGWNAVTVVGDVLRVWPETAIILYTSFIEAAQRDLVLNAGALAVVSKDDPTAALLQAIRDAAAYAPGEDATAIGRAAP